MPVQSTPPSSQTPQASSQANSPFTLANVAPPASTPNATQKSGSGKMKWIVVGVVLIAFAVGAFYSYQKFTAEDVTNVTADVPSDVNGDEAAVASVVPEPATPSDAPAKDTSEHDIVTPNSTPVVEPPLDSTPTDAVTSSDTTTTTDTTSQKVPRPK